MSRKIKDSFINELLKKSLNPLLRYVQLDDTLNMELRGSHVTLYYRGGAILTVKDDSYKFEPLDNKYLQGKMIINPSIENIEDYIPKAKHFIDIYVNTVRNHLGEKEIQQEIAKENNFSANSLDTDYFIIDTEYQDLGRFDIVALQWDSKSNIRKLPKSFKPVITIFEVKQGCNSIESKEIINDGIKKYSDSGMAAHLQDFNEFISTKNIQDFKEDMIAVFQQKRKLKLIKGAEKYKEVKSVSDNIEFVFLLSNYKSESSKLLTELNKISDCKFIFANPMGYGLYVKNIINKQEFINRFLWKSLSTEVSTKLEVA